MRVAVISDLPRLSPAEALEDYQKKGLIAPGGTDVYSDLKALLADYLYDVHYINPRTPSHASRRRCSCCGCSRAATRVRSCCC